MPWPSAARLARQLLDGGAAAVPAGQLSAVVDLLKAEADRQINVDSQRSLEIAELICALNANGRLRGLGLLTRADALRELGRYADAADAYQAAAAVFREVGDEVGWARTRSGAALTARYTGAPVAQLLGELDAARAILGDRQLWLRLTRLEQNTGLLLAASGRVADALAAHERALAAAERLTPRDDLLEAEVLANLAIAYHQVDDHDRAEGLYTRAVAIFEREGQHEHVARAHRNYARFAVGRGHYSKALAAVLPGRRTLLSIGRTDAAAHLGQVGVDCLVRLNRAVEAAELAERVAAEFESTGARVEAAVTHGLRSLALARLGNGHDALLALDRAQALFGVGDWDSGAVRVRLGRAVVLGETGQWAVALNEAQAVRDELRRRGAIVSAAEADLVRARALRALGQPFRAKDAASAALQLIEGRALPWLSYQAHRLLGELARDAGDSVAALASLLEAIDCLEQVQGRIITEYRASFLADKSDVYEAAVGLLLDQRDTATAFELVERAKSRALVDALAGGLDIRVRPRTDAQRRLSDELTRLRREYDVLVEGGAAEPAEASRLEHEMDSRVEELRLAGADELERLSLLDARVYSPRSQLDDETALVQFFFAEGDLLVFVMDRQRLVAHRQPGAMARIAQLQRGLQLNLDAAATSPDRRAALGPNARGLLRRLYAELLEPIAHELDGYARLVMLPHGSLHQVPFAALHDGKRYLVEGFEIVVAPSASSLSFCLRPRARAGNRAVVVAHSGHGALPGVLAEASAVAALFPGECLLEDDVTIDLLRARARGADLLHIASHGVSRPDAPLYSFIRLADGHLTALDCFELELDCALVTLSACESGRAVVDAGDEQIGLPRAFLYAGARAVLHSLWRIDDRATEALMTRFYTELRAGRGRGAALRVTQLAALHEADAHPFLWAPLTLVGDWRS